MSYSLKSFKGGCIGDYIGDYYKGYLGGSRCLDCGSSDRYDCDDDICTFPLSV